MTDESCQLTFAQEKARFLRVVGFSLFLTVVVLVVSWCYRSQIRAERFARLYAAAAVVKIGIGLLLLTVWSPKCPAGCDCGEYHASYMFPLMVILVGNVWAYRSKKLYDGVSQQQQEPVSSGMGAGETSIPKQEQENELV